MTLTEYLAADPDRCQHGYHRTAQTCPDCGKAHGIAVADAAASDEVRGRIDAAIRQVAARGDVFSANQVRALLPGVTGPLMGARFNAAAKAGLIVHVGYEPSTKGSTHSHPIAQWRGAA